VYFTSSESFDGRDVNGREDVYRWKDGVRTLISTGKSPDPSIFMDVSADERDVFFLTSERLVAQDNDRIQDLYVARRGGGIAAQNVAPPADEAGCDGDACQGLAPSGVPASRPGSDSSGDGGSPVRRAAFSGGALSESQRKALARGGAVSVMVKVNRPGRVTVVGRAKLGKRTVTVASGSRSATKAGKVSVRLRLSSRARDWLKRGKPIRLVLTTRFSGVGEPLVHTMTLRAADSKPRKKGATGRTATAPATRNDR
jgi:hypothetical protein